MVTSLGDTSRQKGMSTMAAERRIGLPDAKNRNVLLDAAEQLMLEEGYASVSSRRVAAKAGLKSQLVHYYFRTMDDLFLAMFRRRAEEGLRHQEKLLASERPLRALWEFNTEPASTAFSLEFGALSNHRKVVRTEVARYSGLFRSAQLEAVSEVMKRYKIPPEVCEPTALVVLMTAAARIMSMESKLGLTTGHRETIDTMERYIDRLESYGEVASAKRSGRTQRFR